MNVTCNESGHIPVVNHKILNLTANRFHYYQGQYLHLAAIVYESLPNEVIVYDVDKKEQFAKPIMFPRGYEGQI